MFLVFRQSRSSMTRNKSRKIDDAVAAVEAAITAGQHAVALQLIDDHNVPFSGRCLWCTAPSDGEYEFSLGACCETSPCQERADDAATGPTCFQHFVMWLWQTKSTFTAGSMSYVAIDERDNITCSHCFARAEMTQITVGGRHSEVRHQCKVCWIKFWDV